MQNLTRITTLSTLALSLLAGCSAPSALPPARAAFSSLNGGFIQPDWYRHKTATPTPAPTSSSAPTGAPSAAPTATPKPTPTPAPTSTAISTPKPTTPPATPAPAAPPAGNVRTHTLSAMFDQDSDSQIAAGFGSWSNLAQYNDMVVYQNTYRDAAIHGAGMKIMTYSDPNLCSGNYSTGANHYAGPDCAPFPNTDFYQDNSGNPVTVSYNGQIIQKIGNPGSAGLQNDERNFASNQKNADPYVDYLEIDDAGTPDEDAWMNTFCWGMGTLANNAYSCSGAPGGTAGSPWGPTYSIGQWQNGESALVSNMPIPAVLNGLGQRSSSGTIAASASVIASNGNALGGMCDGCFYGDPNDNVWKHAGDLLNAQLTSIMKAVGAGKIAIMMNSGGVTDTSRRQQALADILLAYNPDLTYMLQQSCGSVSAIHVCAEQGLTFYQPLNGYPTSTSSLSTSTGAYAREFGACYNRGVLIGPCAAVVNPQATSTVSMPVLSRSYGHTLVISGTGPCNCYGDTGSVAFNGPAAPTTLPAASGYVLFQ